MTTERADHLSRQDEKTRQGTGPSQMVLVLGISLLMTIAAGVAIVIYFYMG